jgi:lipopolysaccharide transport system ATP-binding protein
VHTSEENYIHINGNDLTVQIDVNMPFEKTGMAISFQIYSENEMPVIYAYNFDGQKPILRTKGIHQLRCTIPKCKLYQGEYNLKVHLAESKSKTIYEEIDKICHFQVIMKKEIIEWGWQKGVCIYTEDFNWS